MKKNKIIQKDKKVKYAKDLMPHNRIQLFKDIFVQNWRMLFIEGLIILLMFLPSLILLFFRDYYIATLATEHSAGNLTMDEYTSNSQIGYLIFTSCSCVCLLFFSIAISGLTKVNQYCSVGDPTSFRLDFNDGVKKNIKVNLIYTSIYIVLLLIAIFIKSFVVNGIGAYIFFGVVQAIYFPILIMIYYSNNIYSWKKKHYFTNNFWIYIKHFVFIFLISLIVSVAGIILFVNIGNTFVWKYILIIILILFFSPVLLIFYNLFMNYIFDKTINLENYPELYDKGITRINNKKEK